MRSLRFLVAAVLTFLILLPAANAHSGRTDSQGGHYNHSTGEYHFHHGHSAHQHPNGTCQYDPSGRTDWPISPLSPMTESDRSVSSGSSGKSSSSGSSVSITPKSDPTPSSGTAPSNTATANATTSEKQIGLPAIAASLIAVWIFVRLLSKLHKQRVEKKRIAKERDFLVSTYSGMTKTDIAISCGMPRSLRIGDDGLPHDNHAGSRPDCCTVYVARSGTTYHASPS